MCENKRRLGDIFELGRTVRLAAGFCLASFSVAFLLSAFSTDSASARQATSIAPDAPDIEASTDPLDPLKMVISLKSQRIDVYQGRTLINSSRISSGKAGYGTPTGVFSILQRNRWHRSNIYSNAPMPFMQRLTWSGIALHAGYVPNYPASHGCVRLPKKFATTLFGMTNLGAHVVIAKDDTQPQDISHPNLFQPVTTSRFSDHSYGQFSPDVPAGLELSYADLRLANLEADWMNQQIVARRSLEPLRILITRRTGAERMKDIQSVLNELGFEAGDVDGYFGRMTAAAVRAFQESQGLQPNGMITDTLLPLLYEVAGKGSVPTGHIYVRQNFKDIFDMPVVLNYPDEPLGTYLYTVMYFKENDSHADWLGLAVDPGEPGTTDMRRALDRVVIPPMVRTYIGERLTPGSSLIISDNGISRETGRGTDFVVLTN